MVNEQVGDPPQVTAEIHRQGDISRRHVFNLLHRLHLCSFWLLALPVSSTHKISFTVCIIMFLPSDIAVCVLCLEVKALSTGTELVDLLLIVTVRVFSHSWRVY